MTVAFLWFQLVGTAAIILVASKFLARSADVVSEKTGLGKAFVGVVMLATATSLPELGTGVSAIVLVDEPDLAAGDALGSNIVNLLLIGLLDLFWRKGPILDAVSPTSLLVAALGIMITSMAAVSLFIHTTSSIIPNWSISPMSVFIFLLFVCAMFLTYRHDVVQSRGARNTLETSKYTGESLLKSISTYAVCAIIIIAAAISLSSTGGKLAESMGWETSFVGTQFLSIATTLPEIATSFAAIGIDSPDLAITNLLGSNLFNHGFILFLDDVVYTDGTLWQSISRIHSLSTLTAILMTSVVMVGLMTTKHRWPGRYWTPEGIAIVVLYVINSTFLFYMA